jgi:hypothetical protein
VSLQSARVSGLVIASSARISSRAWSRTLVDGEGVRGRSDAAVRRLAAPERRRALEADALLDLAGARVLLRVLVAPPGVLSLEAVEDGESSVENVDSGERIGSVCS